MEKSRKPKLAAYSLSLWQNEQGNWEWSVHKRGKVLEHGLSSHLSESIEDSQNAMTRFVARNVLADHIRQSERK